MFKKFMFGAVLAAMLAFCLAVIADDKPFEGSYEMKGPAGDLLKGDKILIEDYISPICPHCYLFWKNRKSFGPDVDTKIYYLFNEANGKQQVKLLMVARGLGGDLEEKALTAIYEDNYGSRIDVQSMKYLDGLAEKLGFGAAWKEKKNSAELTKQMDDMLSAIKEQGINRTPTIVIQHSILVSAMTCGCTGEAAGRDLRRAGKSAQIPRGHG